MKLKNTIITIALLLLIAVIFSFKDSGKNSYATNYFQSLKSLSNSQSQLLENIKKNDFQTEKDLEKIRKEILNTRLKLKGMDFWFRYFEPNVYKKMNGPLPVEWETEVFEKYEKPYKREGAGLSLAIQYIDEENPDKDTLLRLIQSSIDAEQTYSNDSITVNLQSYHHFYLCNRLYLLNLAAIYTTGFECPDTASVIPELKVMMTEVNKIYKSFNESFPDASLNTDYLILYDKTLDFVAKQSSNYSSFDHFIFIRDYINPLFTINRDLIKKYRVSSKNMLDYSLNKEATSIFKKNLYNGQNSKGVFLRMEDTAALNELERLGKMLFYDPILSGNNMRSCASCHKAGQYFTDTTSKTSLHFNQKDYLSRNTPSLLNAEYNHLLMIDGKHFTLQHQITSVVSNETEMCSSEKQALAKVMSCKDYKKSFNKLLKYTPQESEITFEHIASAISYYYSRFSTSYAPFDEAMNKTISLDPESIRGFNIFMSKAQCATCHFVPQFNGVKPPYVGSEFEVLGVPADTGFKMQSADKGRYEINPASQTLNAFRTGTIRNAAYTMPYMHNGVFSNLMQVINFYNNGGGAGKGLVVNNQTLSSDPLGLSEAEKQLLIKFIMSLTEQVKVEQAPKYLPFSSDKSLNKRISGGIY
ncbi:MAG: cytochrome C peroxidase [Bacteroidia bacterium]|nr:cytochrome C peroxidase [Bacteroidia bacterium]